MTARLDAAFARARAQDRAALITYVMAGDPDPGTSLAVLRALPGAGADIVELGLPFTDPMAASARCGRARASPPPSTSCAASGRRTRPRP